MPKKSKNTKLFDNLLKVTEQCMKGKGYSPLTEKELMKRLSLPEQHQELFREVLDTLKKADLIQCVKHRYSCKAGFGEILSGTMRLHSRGFGFVEIQDSALYPEDVFIPKHLTMGAIEGDLVEVLVNPSTFSEKGPEGKVISISKRARTHLGAIIQRLDKKGNAIAYAPLLGVEQTVQVIYPKTFSLRVGDRVVLKVEDWGKNSAETTASLFRIIGNIDDPSFDIPAALEEFGLPETFSQKAVLEAKSFGTRIKPSDLKDRLDLRSFEIFTIDPDTAKDFDDALHISKEVDGSFRLGVHIADVSHYVSLNSSLDKEAKLRANSTYFPRYCLPMLPKELSENLCSLKPHVQRLTISVLMTFNPQGELTDYAIQRSVIKSCHRFTYKQAKEVLEGKKKSQYFSSLKLMQELCKLLKEQRKIRGSLEFTLPEMILHTNEKGEPTHTEKVEYDITHQLVEEFMLKANEIVATHLDTLGKGLTFRIHDVPSEENMRDFSALAGAFGFKISDLPTAQELQALFEEAMQTPYGQYLATCYIKRMRLAAYSADNIGHFGLSLSHYCHFTSPIRRYADLIVHRILFGQELDKTALEKIASHCSSQERISAKAEQSVLTLKKLRLLQNYKKQKPKKIYPAVVTRIKPFGIYFEIVELMMEGFFHVSELPDDYYVFDEITKSLKGTRRRKVLQAGDQLNVKLISVDLVFQQAFWSLI